MCRSCFEYVPMDKAWVDSEGRRQDLCSACAGRDLAERVINQLRRETFGENGR